MSYFRCRWYQRLMARWQHIVFHLTNYFRRPDVCLPIDDEMPCDHPVNKKQQKIVVLFMISVCEDAQDAMQENERRKTQELSQWELYLAWHMCLHSVYVNWSAIKEPFK